VRFLEFLEPIIAYGDSLSAEQHLARLTRKSQPSVASNYQAGFTLKVSKGRRTRRRLLMDYTF